MVTRNTLSLLFCWIMIVSGFSCAEKDSETSNAQKNSKEIAKLDVKIERVAKLELKVEKLENAVQSLFSSSKIWVLEQSSNDIPEKIAVKKTIEESLLTLTEFSSEMEKNGFGRQEALLIDFESFLTLVDQIMTTLDSFEKYEDAVALFSMRVLIEPDGKLDLATKKLLIHLKRLKHSISQQKDELETQRKTLLEQGGN